MRNNRTAIASIDYSGYKQTRHNNHMVYVALSFFFTTVYLLFDFIGVIVGAGLIFTLIVLVNMGRSIGVQVPLIHVMVFNYFMQLVVAALVNYFYRPAEAFAIDYARYPAYLSYAVPSCIALYIGGLLALRRMPCVPFSASISEGGLPAWALYSRHFFWYGLIVTLIIRTTSGLVPGNVLFVAVLLSSLRYVGFFAIVLSGDRRWWIYGLIILSMEAFLAIASGFIHDLVLWGIPTVLIVFYRYNWKNRVPVVILTMFFLLYSFQSVKNEYRQSTSGQGIPISERIIILSDLLSKNSGRLFDKEIIGGTFARFNQGWIVDRVMQHVPMAEAYANGNTFLEGFYPILVPRFIDPDKPIAGGRKNFEKYTGIILNSSTAMNIGVAGEMYANFGPLGGVLGMAVFGFFMGFLYRSLYRRAAENRVWWAWGPFVGFFALKAEEGFMETIVWSLRGIVVMATLIFVCNRIARPVRRKEGRVYLRQR